MTGFSVRTDGVGRIEFLLDVGSEIQRKMLIGYKGKNLTILKEKATIGLINKFKKDFIIYIYVKVRSQDLRATNMQEEQVHAHTQG